MKNIKIAFTDFWKSFDYSKSFFKTLFDRRGIHAEQVDPADAEVLFFSAMGRDHLKYPRPVRIFYTGENVAPNPFWCDASFSFEKERAARHQYHVPVWLLNMWMLEHPETLRSREELSRLERKRFCGFLYGNDEAGVRKKFFHLLNGMRHVDSGGPVLNNMGYMVNSDGSETKKVAFQRECRFTISFENTKCDRYTTEKIIHPFLAGSIPIYWGNSLVADIFNSEAMVRVDQFPSLEAAARRVIEIDDNPRLREEMVRKPVFNGGVSLEQKLDHVAACLEAAVFQKKRQSLPWGVRRFFGRFEQARYHYLETRYTPIRPDTPMRKLLLRLGAVSP